MRTTVATLILAAIGGVVPMAAQTPAGGTITGSVVDASGRPIADADVFALPEKVRARTDSAGRFTITKLGAGFYHVRVRRLGFRPNEITTDLANNGHVEL
jgi:protocatechuate 3,4-dioxygenase beta subunit